jgi:hypothetical protein
MGALREGLRALRQRAGLVPLLLAANLGLAALLAVPLGVALEKDLRNKDAAVRMTEGFDYDWWSEWSARQSGPARHLSPEILGLGFAARDLESLLKGRLPAALFTLLTRTAPQPGVPSESRGIDPTVLALGVASMTLQLFLGGGVLGVFRALSPQWTIRGFLLGAGFYFGRFVRVALVALVAAGVVFAVMAPISALVEALARGSVSETSAIAWSFARYGALLVALGFVHMASSYAKVLVVFEERQSAALAFLSGLSFAVRHLGRSALQYLVVVLAAVFALGVWYFFDAAFEPTGYRRQLLFFLVAEVFVAGRVALRLWLAASQVALYRAATTVP